MFKIYSASSSSTSEVTLTQVLDSAHYIVQVVVAAPEAAVAPEVAAQVEAVVVVLLLVLKRPAVYRQAFVPIADAEVKVSKIQKQIFLFSFEPKNERNYFLNSALASKSDSTKWQL